jgi:hypothetical protein
MQTRTMLLAGRPFACVEDTIDSAEGLSMDEKAAVWLYAWSHLPPQRQRKVAQLHIEGLAEAAPS